MAETERLRVLLIDDEPLARRRLRALLRAESDVEVVGECASGDEALGAIGALAPDLLFLDVEMPGLDGLALAEAIGKQAHPPLVIFVTAYDQYAVRAFEVRAIDYLLKPFDRERFAASLDRARAQWRERGRQSMDREILALLNELKAPPQYLDRLLIKHRERISVIRTAEIDYLEAEGNYVRVHFGANSALVRETLARLGAQLDPRRFARIHRSRLVNIDRIQELQPWSHRDYRIILRNGTTLALSRRYREQLARLLGKI
jgi:two-component system LytT family response regulator